MDSLIHRALTIDVNPPVALPALTAPRPRVLQWGLAASVLLAIALGIFWLGVPRDTLARDVVEHVMHEADALQPDRLPISEDELAAVLGDSNLRLRSGSNEVTYASTCPLRGHFVPHFVVKTAAGPVTVLLLTREPTIEKPERFKEGGFEGMVMPAPRGLLVVVGKDVPLDEVAQKVFAAVDYNAGW